jgi:hypothetical protein
MIGCGGSVSEREKMIYANKLEATGNIIVQQASACISQARSYMATWEYAKVSDIDFKTALRELGGEETARNKALMIENRTEIERLIESLQDPPPEYLETLQKLEELEEAYLEIHFLVLEPPESMEDFQDSVVEWEDWLVEVKQEFDSILSNAGQ